MVIKMFRWFKKRGQRQTVDKTSAIENKDEYGFDITERRSYLAIDHIYAEIADVNKVDSLPRHREKRRPTLPPRNNQPPINRHKTSYSKWKTLSKRTLSLPELEDAVEQVDFVDFTPYQTSDSVTQGRLGFGIVQSKEGIFTRPDEEIHNDSSINDLMIGFEKSSSSGSSTRNQNYLHPGSDSGYDYSCSSSNESDINDSGLSDCYEFHISKAEQLHKLEREIHLLACHCDKSNMSLDCSWQNSSLTSSAHSFSVPPDLDLDDEISAYQDPKLDFRATIPKSLPHNFRVTTPKSLPHNQPTPRLAKAKLCNSSRKGSVLQSLPARQMTKPDKPVHDKGEITPFPKRVLRGNRLLGDLIRTNNNNLFFT